MTLVKAGERFIGRWVNVVKACEHSILNFVSPIKLATRLPENFIENGNFR